MNEQRREQLKKAMVFIKQATAIIEKVMYEEEKALENLPVDLQESKKGHEMQRDVDYLDNLQRDLENKITQLGHF